MGAVITWVRGRVAPDRQAEVLGSYRAAIAAGLPPDIDQTMLIHEGDELSIVTVWPRREDLDAMLASGAEPFARRLIREAGGEPTVRVFDLLAREPFPGGDLSRAEPG